MGGSPGDLPPLPPMGDGDDPDQDLSSEEGGPVEDDRGWQPGGGAQWVPPPPTTVHPHLPGYGGHQAVQQAVIRPPPLIGRAADLGAVQYLVHFIGVGGRPEELGTLPVTATSHDIVKRWRKAGSFRLTMLDMSHQIVGKPEVIDIAPDHEAFTAEAQAAAVRLPVSAPQQGGGPQGAIPAEVWALIEAERSYNRQQLEAQQKEREDRERDLAAREHDVQKLLANLSIQNTNDVLSTHTRLIDKDQERVAAAQAAALAAEERRAKDAERLHDADKQRTELFFSSMLKNSELSIERERLRLEDERERIRAEIQDTREAAKQERVDAAARHKEELQEREHRFNEREKERDRSFDREMARVAEHNKALASLRDSQQQAQNPANGIIDQLETMIPIKELIAEIRESGSGEPRGTLEILMEGAVKIIDLLKDADVQLPQRVAPIRVVQTSPPPQQLGAGATAPANPAAQVQNQPATPTQAPSRENQIEAAVKALPDDIKKTARQALRKCVDKVKIAKDDTERTSAFMAMFMFSKEPVLAYCRARTLSGALVEAGATLEQAAGAIAQLELRNIIPADVPRQ